MKLSNILKPWKWFQEEIKPEIEPEPEKKTAQSSTDLSLQRARRTGNLNMWIAKNIFPKSHSDIVKMDAKGNSIAMDSASYAMDASDIKSAYTLSADNLPQILFSWYVQQGFIGYQACAVIAQQWLVDKACKVPAEDAIKNNYDLTVNDGSDVSLDIIAEIRKYDKKYKLKKNLVEFSQFNRVFGIRIALFKVESSDDNYYTKPFNIDGVTPGSYKGISQVDPYWITPELDSVAVGDPSSPNFYEPTWWRIGGQRYHRSHLIIIRHSEVADVLKPSYIYGGIPLPQMIYERIYAAERTANEAPQLALTKRMNVVKTDLDKAVSNQKEFEERMEMINYYRDNHGIYVLNEDDEFEQTETTLSDLDALIMTQYQLVAAIARMPATKLIETSPKGFSATGEFEMQTYYDLLECIQGNDTELLDRHYELLIRSAICPKHNIEPFEIEINWKPLKSSTAKEISDINYQNSQTDVNLQGTGAIDGGDVYNRIVSDPDSGYNGMVIDDDEDETDPIEQKLNSEEINEESIPGRKEPKKEDDEGISEISLNGAQVSSMVDVAGQISRGELSRESGLEILTISFPINKIQAEKIIGPEKEIKDE